MKGHAADDELDLVLVTRTANETVDGRILHADLHEAPIRRLEEPYPTADMTCSEHGQLETQTQQYFMCRSDFYNDGDAFRVTSDDYQALLDYPDDFQCYSELVQTNVCMCAPHAQDAYCMTQLDQSCFVNITNPPLYKGCNGTDSDYYMYSLGGYAPCYFYDFTQEYTFDMLIQCKILVDTTNETTPVVQGVDRLRAGYQYRDVVTKPNDVQTDFRLGSWAPELTIKFAVRDMKYLSNSNSSTLTTSDPLVMSGIKEA